MIWLLLSFISLFFFIIKNFSNFKFCLSESFFVQYSGNLLMISLGVLIFMILLGIRKYPLLCKLYGALKLSELICIDIEKDFKDNKDKVTQAKENFYKNLMNYIIEFEIIESYKKRWSACWLVGFGCFISKKCKELRSPENSFKSYAKEYIVNITY